MTLDVTVVGAGLAGSEAAWQLAERGLCVTLVEMRPVYSTPAHRTALFAELVCSNSLKSLEPTTPSGILKAELERLGSLVLAAAHQARVPAGSALAVDRFRFSAWITRQLSAHPRIHVVRRMATELPEGPAILATGPLTAGPLAEDLARACGQPLAFYDAIAPIVEAESIDWDLAFRQSRWDLAAKGPRRGPDPGTYGLKAREPTVGDYVNCPLTEEEYEAFVDALLAARKVPPHPFEEPRYFEACLPIEVLASRGRDVLRYGPMRPVGLVDPRTGSRPHAVVQLRPENRHGTAYNLVGFQTRLTYPEQARVFRMIPALRRARFLRYGSIHRNTYLRAPACLGDRLELRTRPQVRVAGLLAGVEGYVESVAVGLLAALFLASDLAGRPIEPPPETTALGGLYRYLRQDRGTDFTPTNMNMALLPPVETKRKTGRKERRLLAARRALDHLEAWIEEQGIEPPGRNR